MVLMIGIAIYVAYYIIKCIVCAVLGIELKTPPVQSRPRWMDNPQTPSEVNKYIDYWGLDVYEGGYGEHKK